MDRLKDRLTGRSAEPEDAPDPDPDILRCDTPALGDAYDFTIVARLEWHAPGARSSAWERILDTRTDEAMARARQVVRPQVDDVAREVARRFPPHRPADAETALMTALAPGFRVHGFWCKVVVCVTAVDHIRHQLQGHWREQIALELKTERSEMLAAQLGRRRQTWQAFLAAGLAPAPGPGGQDEAWLFRYALKLAVAEEASMVSTSFDLLLDKRREDAEKLTGSLSDVLGESQNLDVLDFLLATDSALRQTMLTLGVALPPLTEGAPLREAADPASGA